jgi:hypothetical protein
MGWHLRHRRKLKHLPRDALLSTAHLWSNVRSIDASGTRFVPVLSMFV